MKTKNKKHISFVLFLIIIITSSCSTLNIAEINKLNKQNFDNTKLNIDYDISNMRIDIIRQEDYDSDNVTTKRPYHPLGFNLGNGIFVDMNYNISLLVLDLFKIHKKDTFLIIRKNYNSFFRNDIIYKNIDINLSDIQKNLIPKIAKKNTKYTQFSVEKTGFIKNKNKTIIANSDNLIEAQRQSAYNFQITTNDSLYTYKTALSKVKINVMSNNNYQIKSLLGNKEFKQTGDTVFIGNKYIIKNLGNAIEIWRNRKLGRNYFIYKIIKSENELFIFNNNFKGFGISKLENKLVVQKNNKKLHQFSKR